MKKLVCFLSIAVIMLVSVVTAFAHPGRTDSKGGHYDRDTGEYHYHHGHSAHQHKNGECPYDFDDAEEYKKSNASQSSFMAKTDSDYEWMFSDYFLLILSIVIIILLGIFSAKAIYEDYQGIEWSIAFYIAFLWAAASIILICYALSFEFVKYNEDGFATQWALCIIIMLIGTPILYVPLSITYWLLWHALSLLLQFIKFIAKHTFPILKEIFDKEFLKAIIKIGIVLLVAIIVQLFI